MSGSETLLKKLPSAVNMSVLVKLVVRPTAASAAKSPGESASCVTSDGKRHTCSAGGAQSDAQLGHLQSAASVVSAGRVRQLRHVRWKAPQLLIQNRHSTYKVAAFDTMYPSSDEYNQLPMSALQSLKRPICSAWAQAWT
jgi:hypothetical protein